MAEGDLTDGALAKLFLTGVILVLMVPGLLIEPGPLSEFVGFAAIGSVWGYDFGAGDGGGGGG
jgi:hypothetical protein